MAQTWEWDGWLRLAVPDDWTVEEDDGVVTLCQPETGCGALQFSVRAYKNPIPDVQEREIETLCEFAQNQDGQIEDLRAWRPVEHEQAVAAYARFVTESDFWETWIVSDGRRRLLFSYNCGLADRGTERDQYGAIIQSAEFLWMGGARLLRRPWYWLKPDEERPKETS